MPVNAEPQGQETETTLRHRLWKAQIAQSSRDLSRLTEGHRSPRTTNNPVHNSHLKTEAGNYRTSIRLPRAQAKEERETQKMRKGRTGGHEKTNSISGTPAGRLPPGVSPMTDLRSPTLSSFSSTTWAMATRVVSIQNRRFPRRILIRWLGMECDSPMLTRRPIVSLVSLRTDDGALSVPDQCERLAKSTGDRPRPDDDRFARQVAGLPNSDGRQVASWLPRRRIRQAVARRTD